VYLEEEEEEEREEGLACEVMERKGEKPCCGV